MSKDLSRTLLHRMVSIVSGFASIILVPIYLDPVAQGFYFSFMSLVGVQVLFELGLSQLLLFKFSFASSQQYHSESLPSQVNENFIDIGFLLYSSRLVYRLMAILFFLVVAPSGFFFFHTSVGLSSVHWQAPWIMLVASVSVNLLNSIKFVYLESQGRIADVSTFRLSVSILSFAICIFCFIFGFGIWAVLSAPISANFMSFIWLYSSPKAAQYRETRCCRGVSVVDLLGYWRVSVLPLQWRMSLSTISGYLIYNLITPVVFSRFGPIIAGKFGFAYSLLSSALPVATTFATILAPTLAGLFSRGEYVKMDIIFTKALRRCFLALLAIAILFIAATNILATSRAPLILDFSRKFLTVNPCIALSVSFVSSGLVYCYSIFLRSQQDEPLLLFSVVQALITVLGVWLSSYVSFELVCVVYASISAFFFMWCRRIYQSSKARLLYCLA